MWGQIIGAESFSFSMPLRFAAFERRKSSVQKFFIELENIFGQKLRGTPIYGGLGAEEFITHDDFGPK